MGSIPGTGWRGRLGAALLSTALAAGLLVPSAGRCADGVARISNVSIREEAEQLVVGYDLNANGATPLRLVGSLDGGRTFSLPIRSVEGDVGPSVLPGPRKILRWNHKKDFPSGLESFELTLQVVPEGRRYFRIPMHGRFGVELDEDPMEDFLRLADAAAPDVVILDIDSPGGSVLEMEDVLDLLLVWKEKHPNVRVVSLVRREAVHAAAFFAVAADNVFFLPGAVVGASEAPAPGGGEVRRVDRDFPEELVEKVCGIAEKRGVARELVRGMVKPARLGVALSPGEARRVVTLGPGPLPPRYCQLGKADRPLRLAAANAVLAGLAVGTVKDYDDLGLQLGYPNWVSCGEGAQVQAELHKKQVARVLEGYDNLSSMIREGLAELDGPGDQGGMDARDAAGYLSLVSDLGRMAEDFPFVAARMEADFPAGLTGLRAELQPFAARPAPALAAEDRAARGKTRPAWRWAGGLSSGGSARRS